MWAGGAAASESTPLIETLAPYLVTATAALFGVWLGHRIERRSDVAAWRREHRLAAYAVYQNEAIELWRLLTTGFTDRTWTDRARHQERFDQIGRLAQAITKIELLGPDRVSNAAEELLSVYRALAGLLSAHRDDFEEVERMRAEFNTDLAGTPLGCELAAKDEVFLTACHKALGTMERRRWSRN